MLRVPFPVPRSLFSPHHSVSKKPPKAQPLFLVQRSRKQTFLQDFRVLKEPFGTSRSVKLIYV